MEGARKFGLNDDFVIHVEIMEEFFCSKDIKDENKKRSNLLTSLSVGVYIVRNLLSPRIPKDVKYDELVTIMKKQFARQAVRYKKRKKFYDAVQISGESVREFFNRIKGLAVNCEFGSNFNDVLKDKFICGMQKGDIFEKMCEIAMDSELDVCVQKAMQRETYLEETTCHKIHKNVKNMTKHKNARNGEAVSYDKKSGSSDRKSSKNEKESRCNAERVWKK